jgi:hypothetical protein
MFNYVQIRIETVVATSGIILSVNKTKEVFGQMFPAQMREQGIDEVYVHSKDMAQLMKAGNDYFSLDVVSDTRIEIRYLNKEKAFYVPVMLKKQFENTVDKFPEWEKVMPGNPTEGTEISCFGINAELLLDMQKALGTTSVELTLHGATRAIYVQPNSACDYTGYGIVMPVAIDR